MNSKIALEKEEVSNNKGSIVLMVEIVQIEWRYPMDTKKKKKVSSGSTSCTTSSGNIICSKFHMREIQTTIHKGIGWVWDKAQFPDAGEFLYDANGIIFNGKGFDGERDIKHTINETFKCCKHKLSNKR